MKCNSLTAVIRGSGGRSLAGSGIEVPSRGKAFLSIKNHYMCCFKQVFRACLEFIAKHRPQVTVAPSKGRFAHLRRGCHICPSSTGCKGAPGRGSRAVDAPGAAPTGAPQGAGTARGWLTADSATCCHLGPVPALPSGSPGNLPARQSQPPCKPDLKKQLLFYITFLSAHQNLPSLHTGVWDRHGAAG